MLWLLAGIGTISAVEIMLWLPLSSVFVRSQSNMRQVLHVIKSRKISDHWKELVVPSYALRMFRDTAQLMLLLVIVVSPIVFVCTAAEFGGIRLLDFLLTATGILFSTVVALSFAWLRVSVARAQL